jgi:hypothetical protein
MRPSPFDVTPQSMDFEGPNGEKYWLYSYLTPEGIKSYRLWQMVDEGSASLEGQGESREEMVGRVMKHFKRRR